MMSNYRQSTASGPALTDAFGGAGTDSAPKRTRRFGLVATTVIVTLAVVGAIGLATRMPAVIGYKADVGLAQPHELQPSPIDPSWILSGSPEFSMAVFERSDFWASSSGIWQAVGPGSFVWHYSVDEDIYVLEGSAEIDYMGRKFTLKAGESTRFVAGTTATWVVNDRIRKTFRIQNPGRVIKALRIGANAIGL
ncbi:MAG: cupin domain-containing protein [Bauldia litoralis]|uniref:cupin domain-containing protein n=2 Tax=Bauldia litoralis TaxID=665467 RepID=UPI003297265B